MVECIIRSTNISRDGSAEAVKTSGTAILVLRKGSGPAAAPAPSHTPSTAGSHHASSPRPHYGGGHHTTSHGGHYAGETNSHHKNPHYKNPNSADRCGQHKP
jgi:hypothetical protein